MIRREFLLSAAATAMAGAKTLSAMGVQLYTVRTVLPEKPLQTLKAIEAMGYREAEVVRATLDQIWPSLKQTNLKPVSLHIDTALFMAKVAELPAALDDAAKKGFKYVVCPYIAPADRGGVPVIEKLAATLNKAGEKCKAAGLTLAYHNHAFEFEPAGSSTLLDVLMTKTDPKLVNLELDIFWAAVAGVDPVSLFKKYSGRIPLVHLKDKKAGTETRYKEGVPKEWFNELGKGAIDMPAILRAGAMAGVKHYFVEQDQTPGDPLDSLRVSAEYLRKLQY